MTVSQHQIRTSNDRCAGRNGLPDQRAGPDLCILANFEVALSEDDCSGAELDSISEHNTWTWSRSRIRRYSCSGL